MNNRLLKSLSARDLSILQPHLVDVELPVRTLLHEAGGEVSHAYFVESGLVSLISAAGPNRIEVGIVGCEAMTGLSAVLGVSRNLHETVVQVSGDSKRIAVADLRACMAEHPTIAAPLLRFVYAFMAQISATALANGRNTVEQRLARWLLMANDRLSGAEITLTHEFLAVMLGVRRPGVTVALHMLEGAHAIRSKRNSITVTDRARLKAVAGPSYGASEALYEMLFGREGQPAD